MGGTHLYKLLETLLETMLAYVTILSRHQNRSQVQILAIDDKANSKEFYYIIESGDPG